MSSPVADRSGQSEHVHAPSLAGTDARTLTRCLELGCDRWSLETITAELRLRLFNAEREIERAHETGRYYAERASRLTQGLITLAPANGRRKTVAAEDVRSLWMEVRDG